MNGALPDFIVRPWVETNNTLEARWAINREVKMRFDHEGIEIPFPQRDVHLHEAHPEPDQAESG